MLAVSQRLGTLNDVISLDIPPPLAPRVQNALKANPLTVDLRALAPHYYSLGERILNLFEDEELVEILSDTFKVRAAEIADHAVNPRGALGEGAEFLRGLEENERQSMFRRRKKRLTRTTPLLHYNVRKRKNKFFLLIAGNDIFNSF